MIIYIASDHRGFELKNYLIDFLKGKGYEVVDSGNVQYDKSDDYPDFAKVVAEKVSLDCENARGIVLCGSGVGVDVVANKFRGVRSALVTSTDQAFDSRNDDDSNILSLPAGYIEKSAVEKIVIIWLETPFSGDKRHVERLKKIDEIEQKNFKSL